MHMSFIKSISSHPVTATTLLSALLLVACGGGGGSGGGSTDATSSQILISMAATGSSEPAASDSTPASSEFASTQVVQPVFHLAPTVLSEPDDSDALDNTASSHALPHVQGLSGYATTLNTTRLTVQDISLAHALEISGQASATPNVGALATPSVVTTYTPAQIRAAYNMPTMPSTWISLASLQAAQMGAGQTIYIVDAMHDPNVAAELAAFNQKFGLPGCTTNMLGTASLPLPTASSSACVFSIAYSTTAGALTTTPPAYNSSWATEITLDVQWAHATAPLARIVLIEAPDASVNSLVAAIQLAARMGSGIVSMSFGANEGSWASTIDSAFASSNMSYLAATGDNGAAVSWPAVSTKVLAVGGTTLSYADSTARTETVWSGTGGGISAYVATPSYQSSLPGFGTPARRATADVAFNADPYSGQYVAVISPGSSTVSWVSAGGTSLSTPQWAGLLAVANATRVQAGKTILGLPHTMLYAQIGAVSATYANSMLDVTSGNDGTCSSCSARVGYDLPTGLGTPKVSSLLTALGGSTTASTPVVSSASVSGVTGTSLSFSVTASSAHPLTYSLSGAPTGMTISSAGVVSWPSPMAGTYAVTVIARDIQTLLSGQGVYTVSITAPKPPVVSSGSISGKTGAALSFSVAVTAANPVSYSLRGAPTGMTISSTGTVSWPSPVKGSYVVTVVAQDQKTLLSGQGSYTVTITAATQAPVITATALTGVAGKVLTGSFTVTDPNGYAMSVSISGVPYGMSFAVSGSTISLRWPSPVTGSYVLKIVATDMAGLSSSTTLPITIAAR